MAARSKNKHRLHHWFEYALARCLIAFTRLLPRPLLYGVFSTVSRLWAVLDRRHRSITLRNLELAFPELSKEERTARMAAAYRHFGFMMADNVLFMTKRMSVSELSERVDTSEWPKLAQTMESAQRGLLVITGHIGNWELMSLLGCALAEQPAAVVSRELTNQYLEDRIVRPFRTMTGVQMCYKQGALRSVMRVLKSGGYVGMLIDQKARLRDGVTVDFFDKEVVAFSSSGAIQKKYDIPVVAMFLIREGDGYKMIVSDPIECGEDDTVLSLVQRHQDAIADVIRQYPEQWFWMHNRWRLPRE